MRDCFSEKEPSRLWKDKIKTIINAKNDCDYNIGDTGQDPVDSVGINEEVQVSEDINTGKFLDL